MTNRLTLGTSQTVRHFWPKTHPFTDGTTMISGTCVQRSTLEAIFTSQGYSISSKTIPPEHTKKSK